MPRLAADVGGLSGANSADMPESMHTDDPGSGAQMRANMARSTGAPKPSPGPSPTAPPGSPQQQQQQQGGGIQFPNIEGAAQGIDSGLGKWVGAHSGGKGDWNLVGDLLKPQLESGGIGMDGTVQHKVNPLLPLSMWSADAQSAFSVAHHVGSAFSALVGGGAAAAPQLAGDWAHLPGWKKAILQGMVGGVAGNDKTTPWIYEHVMPALLQIGANADMIPFVLSMAGEAPTDPRKMPAYLGQVTQLTAMMKDFEHGPKPLELGWDAKLLWHGFGAASMAAMLRLHVAPGKIFRAVGFGDGVEKAFSEMGNKIQPPMGVAPPEDVKALAGSSPYVQHALENFNKAPAERMLAYAATREAASKADQLAQKHGFDDIIHFTEQRQAAASADKIARPGADPQSLQRGLDEHLAGDAPADAADLRRQRAGITKAQQAMDEYDRVQASQETIGKLDPAAVAELDKAAVIPKDATTERPRFDTSLLYGQRPTDPAQLKIWENQQKDYFGQWKKYLGIKGLSPDQLRTTIGKQMGAEVKGARARLWQDEQARLKRINEHLGSLSNKGPLVSSIPDLVQQAEHGLLTDEQASYVQKYWDQMGLPYDLKARYPEGRDIPDPRQTLK